MCPRACVYAAVVDPAPLHDHEAHAAAADEAAAADAAAEAAATERAALSFGALEEGAGKAAEVLAAQVFGVSRGGQRWGSTMSDTPRTHPWQRGSLPAPLIFFSEPHACCLFLLSEASNNSIFSLRRVFLSC